MFRVILIIIALVHLPIRSAEQEVPRPETPSETHIVTIHKRSSRTASFSVASTIVSQISSSRRNSASSISTLELSDNTPSTTRIPIKTDSPRHTIPIQVSPKSENSTSSDASSLFPLGYLGNTQGNIPTTDIDDDTSATCKSCFIASCCVAGIFTGLVFGLVAIIKRYGSGS